jgi:hypothetical protein
LLGAVRAVHPATHQLEEDNVARNRRTVGSIVVVGALALAAIGVTGALAQSDDAAGGASDSALLERLDALDPDLPTEIPPADVDFTALASGGVLVGEATSTRAILDLVEPDLRALFVDADDADGPVADAVALIARGWLDVWTGTASLSTAEGHDLAFPTEAEDDFGVATGADELRGAIEVGLELVLAGGDRLLDGYATLTELNAADAGQQAAIDARTAFFELYDDERAPQLAAYLGEPAPSVLVPVDRFETDAPGVRSRATALTLTCVDREALEETGGVLTDEIYESLVDSAVDRLDCPSLDLPEAEPEDVGLDAFPVDD